MKRCSQCKSYRSLADYARNQATRDGLQNICKDCWKTINAKRKDKQKKYRKQWKERNREKAKQQGRESYKRNQKKEIDRSRKKYANTSAAHSVRCKAWRDKNPDKRKLYENRRRVLEQKAEGSHTVQEWVDKCLSYGRRCAYCKRDLPLTRHHVEPLSKGGSDWISNVVPACRSCNSSIGTKTVWPEEVCHH